MNRHAPGNIVWTLDRLLMLWQAWKERFGHKSHTEAAGADRRAFEAEWSARMTKMVGRPVTASGVQLQLRHGFSKQSKVSRNHFWTFASNRAARLHAGARRGPEFDHEWPEQLGVRYVSQQQLRKLRAQRRRRKAVQV